MKKITILTFLSFFLAAPAFAQTHRLQKREKQKAVKTSKPKVRTKARRAGKSTRKQVTHKRVVTKVRKKSDKRHRRVQKRRVYKKAHKNHARRHAYRRPVYVHADVFDDNFVMPALNCPYRTREVASGYTQWCETRRGVRHGAYRRWNLYGDLLVTGFYDHDSKHGAWTEYHTNGYVHREIEYDVGQRCGTWSSWDRNGVSLSVILY